MNNPSQYFFKGDDIFKNEKSYSAPVSLLEFVNSVLKLYIDYSVFLYPVRMFILSLVIVYIM